MATVFVVFRLPVERSPRVWENVKRRNQEAREILKATGRSGWGHSDAVKSSSGQGVVVSLAEQSDGSISHFGEGYLSVLLRCLGIAAFYTALVFQSNRVLVY